MAPGGTAAPKRRKRAKGKDKDGEDTGTGEGPGGACNWILPYKVTKVRNNWVKICIAVLLQLFYIGAFLQFMISSYSEAMSMPFLSLESESGCSTVMVQTTEAQLLDVNGNWETSAAFDP